MNINNIENKIYNLIQKQNQIALKKLLDNEDNIIDYSLKVVIGYLDESYTIDVKPYLLNDMINDDLFRLRKIQDDITDIKYDVDISYKYNLYI
ncbi:MAG: hypothetical protein DRG78_00930 [Epsilonproteobacteria bacterium]|nr:MAG: hypothetical protein DRG78_00930 [Campylobacterota bacterium]